MAYTSYLASFPRQKLTIKQKNQEWREKCVDGGIQLISIQESSRRSGPGTKLRNYNLYNGKFDKSDMENSVDPLSGAGYSTPAELQYRDIVSPIFNLLFGEETKRGLNFIVRAVNEDAISEKEKAQKDAILQTLEQHLTQAIDPSQMDPENPPPPPEQIQKYFTYEYQDMRESVATNMLQFLIKHQKLNQVFQKGWEDSLIAGEEIYKIERVADEPIVRRCNPLEVYTLLPHNCDNLDEADIIVEETFMAPGAIIDKFYEDLEPGEIDEIENYLDDKTPFQASGGVLPPKSYIQTEEYLTNNGSLDNNSYVDEHGNLRVVHVTWKSRKKLGELTYLDEETGEQVTEIVDESLDAGAKKAIKADPDADINWFWINEYWEGTKIGHDIYVNIQPKESQCRSMDNLSKCKSGYVGTIYNANNATSVSLMDRLVPWIYLYITIWYRTEMLMAANQGKIALIDMSLMPDGWDVDKWLYYASIMKIGFVDSYAEGRKGERKGKLNQSTQNRSLDLETGAAISGHIQILEYIEDKVYKVAGISPQRLGAIANRESVGGVERSVTQSSHITEKWFEVHNWTKQRVLEQLLEVSKEIWGEGDSKKFQYVADDLASVLFTMDGTQFNEADYGIFVTNANKDLAGLEAMKQNSANAVQAGTMQLSDMAEVYMSESLGDIKNKLKQSEQLMQEQQQAKAQSEQEAAQQLQAQSLEFQREKEDREDSRLERELETKIDVAQIQAFGFQGEADANDNGIPDALEAEKFLRQAAQDDRKISLDERKQQADEKAKQKELEIKEKELSIKRKQQGGSKK